VKPPTAPLPARAAALWLLLMCLEMLQGTLRTLLLAPVLGDFPARQLSVFTGSLLNFAVTYACTPWLAAPTRRARLLTGALWLVLTLAFELSLGRFVFGLSWERLAEDFRLWDGGLLPIGLVMLAFSPLAAAALRARRG
jgi:hypothetical protein